MVATRGRTFKRPWRGSCHSSKLKSSSAPIGRKDSWCFHGVGSSNAPLLGSTAAEGLQRIGRTSIATRWRFCGLPQSASCSENFVIPPDVFVQTLREQPVHRMKRLEPIFAISMALVAVVGSIGSAPAQDYPSRPITMIVPYPAGGLFDALARILAEPMRGALAQSVVIENVGGAGGSIAVGRVARAAPDGYT